MVLNTSDGSSQILRTTGVGLQVLRTELDRESYCLIRTEAINRPLYHVYCTFHPSTTAAVGAIAAVATTSPC